MLYRKRATLLVCLLLVIVTLAVFGQTIKHEFVQFDDDVYITLNTHVLQYGLSRATIGWAFQTMYNANWHPLTWISYLADAELFAFNPGGYHLTSLLLHLANVLLLFLLLRRLTGSLWRSAFVAALFAIHPLHVESVAWVSERKDVLSTLFWLLTMWAYVRYTERTTMVRQLTVWVAFGLGLMAKPMLVTLPIVLLLMDYWPLGRVGKKQAGNLSIADLVWEKVPLFGLSAASCFITFKAQQASGSVGGMETLSIGVRAANAVVACVGYIGKMILPLKLSVFYPHPGSTIPPWQVIASVLLLLCITALVIRLAKTRPYLAAGWSWYIVTLMPVIGLVQVGKQGMADRYTYVPLIGLFIMVVWGVSDAVGARGKRDGGESVSAVPHSSHSPTLSMAAVLVILLLSAVAWRQTSYWRNSETLFEHGIAVTRDNARLHANLGMALRNMDRNDDAIPHLEEAVRIEPDLVEAHNNLAVAYYFASRYRDSWREVEICRELGLEPNAEFIGALREKMPEPAE